MHLHLPHPYKERNRTDSKLWRGLAVILALDGPSRDFIGHRTRTLLVAAAKFLSMPLWKKQRLHHPRTRRCKYDVQMLSLNFATLHTCYRPMYKDFPEILSQYIQCCNNHIVSTLSLTEKYSVFPLQWLDILQLSHAPGSQYSI